MSFWDVMGNSDAPAPARKDTRTAWVFIAIFMVTFPLAALVSELVLSAFGFHSAEFSLRPAPGKVLLLSNICGMIVFALPSIGVVFFGRRAVKRGDDSSKMVMLIGLLIGIGIPVLLIARLVFTVLTR